MLLLFLVFYLYAIVGFYLYGDNAPFHFGSLYMSLLILFRVSLLENWSDIMYLNIFGCDHFINIYVTPDEMSPNNKPFHCDKPSQDFIIAPFYFVSFVVVSAFIIMSLFIGAITMSMSESIEEMKVSELENSRAERMEQNQTKMKALIEKSAASKLFREQSMHNSDKSESPEEIKTSVHIMEHIKGFFPPRFSSSFFFVYMSFSFLL